jgi:excisionase family DNA binding protein
LDPISIPQAADVLRLSPGRVHALVAHGQIPAVKVGGRWLLERGEVERRRRQGALRGRPFAPHNAWALLRLASGEDPGELDSSVRSRMRKVLANERLEGLAPRLARRGELLYFEGHRGEVPYVVRDPRLVASGVSAAGAHGLDLVSGQEVDGYIRAGAVGKLAADHALRPGSRGANVRLRAVPDRAWSFPAEARIAPLAAVALDLAEDADPRSAAAGREALASLKRKAP